MIHSMSGGIIRDPGTYTFVKVQFEGEDRTYWYIADFAVSAGDTVSAPFGKADMPREGVAVQVEKNVSGQVTPVPIRAAKKLYGAVIK